MKFFVVLSVLSFVVLNVSSTQWQDIKSPMDSPKYKEIMAKLLLDLNANMNEEKITGRVANGQPAKLGDFPYQVYMYLYEGTGLAWLCGGSVKTENFVVSSIKIHKNLSDYSQKMDSHSRALCRWCCES